MKNCNKNILNFCQLIDEDWKDRIITFYSDISQDDFILEIEVGFLKNKKTLTLGDGLTRVQNTLIIEDPELNIGRYQYKLIRIHEGTKRVLLSGYINVVETHADDCDCGCACEIFYDVFEGIVNVQGATIDVDSTVTVDPDQPANVENIGTDENVILRFEIPRGQRGLTGLGLEFDWQDTQLGVRVEGDANYQYVDLKGDKGDNLEFTWRGTELGVRVEGDDEYQYVDLKGDKGDQGVSGGIDNILFDKFRSNRTEEQILMLNQAIIDIEFYNVKETQSCYLYIIGKNRSSNTYLSFLLYPRDRDGGTKRLFVEGWGAMNVPYDPVEHSGIKEYNLVDSFYSGDTIYGRVVINWDNVPAGAEGFIQEPNSSPNNDNTRFKRSLYHNSELYNNRLGHNRFSLSEDLDVYFDSPEIESYSSGATGSGNAPPKSPYEDCLNWLPKWDELMNNAPDGYTVTKELLTDEVPTDTEPSGFLPMYAYKFRPSLLGPGDSSEPYDQELPKIYVQCSLHGYEKLPSFVAYEFLKLMFDSWKDYPLLEYLRYNVEWNIIPVANPHGWNANGGTGDRLNYNGVDLNRNFPIKWTSSFPNAGSGPLSEIESQVIQEFMEQNVDNNTIIGLDFHNFHGTGDGDISSKSLMWIEASQTQWGQSAANVLIKKLSHKYKEKSNFINQSEGHYIGTWNNNFVNRSATSLKQLGSQFAATFELAQNFRPDPNFSPHDQNAMTFGVESFANFIRVFLRMGIDEYNRTHTYAGK